MASSSSAASSASQGLTAEQIKDLNTLNGGNPVFYDGNCCVCLTKLDDNLSDCAIWPCGHMMCKSDSTKWSDTTNTCPTCRAPCVRIMSVAMDTSGKITGTPRNLIAQSNSSGPSSVRIRGGDPYQNYRVGGRHSAYVQDHVRSEQVRDITPKSIPFSPEQIAEFMRLIAQEQTGTSSSDSASSSSSSDFASASVEVESGFGARFAAYSDQNGLSVVCALDHSGTMNASSTDIFLLIDTSGSMCGYFGALLQKIRDIKSNLGRFDRLCIICYHSEMEFYCQLSPRDKLPSEFYQTWSSGSTNTKLGFETLIRAITEGQTTKLLGATTKVIAFTDGAADNNCHPGSLIGDLSNMMGINLTIAVLGNGTSLDVFLPFLPEDKKHCIETFIDPSGIPSNVGNSPTVATNIRFATGDEQTSFSGILNAGKEIITGFPVKENPQSVFCAFVDNTGNERKIQAIHDPSLTCLKVQEIAAKKVLARIEAVNTEFIASAKTQDDISVAKAKIEEISKEATVEHLGPFCEGVIRNIQCTVQSIENPRVQSYANSRVSSQQQANPNAQTSRIKTRSNF